MDKVEQPKPELNSIEQFLSEKRSITRFPELLSFKSPDLTLSLLDLTNQPETAKGLEVGGVLYTDTSENILLHKISTGTKEGVEMFIIDMSKWPDNEVAKFVSHRGNEQVHSYPRFVLVPPNFPLGDKVNEGVTFKKGRQILGSVHTHPNGNPPSPQDFAIALYGEEERNYGVLTSDNLYLFMQSTETPSLNLESSNDGHSTTLHDLATTLENDVQELEDRGLSLSEARMKVLISQCNNYNIGFYYGDIRKNVLKKMT